MKTFNGYRGQSHARRRLLGWAGAMAIARATTIPALLAGCASGRIDFTQGWLPTSLPANPWRSDRAGTSTRVMLLSPNSAPGLRHGLASVVRALHSEIDDMLALTGGVRVDERALPGMAEALKSRTPVATGGGASGPPADVVVAFDIVSISSQAATIVRDPPPGSANPAARPPTLAGQRGRVVLLYGLYGVPGPKTLLTGNADSGPDPATSLAPPGRQPDEVFGGATRGALAVHRHRMIDIIAPLGEILEARQNDKGQRIVRVSLGSRLGAATDHVVGFRRLKAAPRAGQRPMADDLESIGYGRISQSIDTNQSWVLVSDAAIAAALRQGDLVLSSYGPGIVVG